MRLGIGVFLERRVPDRGETFPKTPLPLDHVAAHSQMAVTEKVQGHFSSRHAKI